MIFCIFLSFRSAFKISLCISCSFILFLFSTSIFSLSICISFSFFIIFLVFLFVSVLTSSFLYSGFNLTTFVSLDISSFLEIFSFCLINSLSFKASDVVFILFSKVVFLFLDNFKISLIKLISSP
ncbi:MAG: hypothetical protein PHN22_02530 [Candidatus ainarchaeum sp.]|nr:hypothetical protein [Candidatus ainarchaeum sp.]